MGHAAGDSTLLGPGYGHLSGVRIPYLPALTKLTQSPWFLNFSGMVKTFQPSFLHWFLLVGGPIPGVMATPTGSIPTGTVATTVLVPVSITETELVSGFVT